MQIGTLWEQFSLKLARRSSKRGMWIIMNFEGRAWLKSGIVTYLRMASFAVIHGKRHIHMTCTAEITVYIPFHGKGLGPFLLNIEDLGVTA